MPTAPSQKKVADSKPLISPEADKALGKIVIQYIPATFALLFALPMIVVYVGMKFPHNIWLRQQGILYDLSLIVWIAPFYAGVYKVSEKRLEFGRRYLAEERWAEAAAALDSFDKFGQRFFDRTGEAHYLWAIALEKTGRKAQAEKARDFVRNHRSGSPWAQKLAKAAPSTAPIPTASTVRQRQKASGVSADESAVHAAVGAKKTISAQQQQRGRRRRF